MIIIRNAYIPDNIPIALTYTLFIFLLKTVSNCVVLYQLNVRVSTPVF